MPSPTDPQKRWSASTRPPPRCCPTPAHYFRWSWGNRAEDYEYRREGTRNLFLACESLAAWRHVTVTERRTTEDFAH